MTDRPSTPIPPRIATIVWVACAPILLACVTPTQVVVHVTADPASSAQAAFLTFEVYAPDDAERPRYAQTASFEDGDLPRLADAPARLTVVPRDRDGSRDYRVVASLRDAAGSLFAQRSVISTFLEGTVGEVWIHFDDACIDHLECEGRTTCDGTVDPGGAPRCTPACVTPSYPGTTVRSEPASCGSDCAFASDGDECTLDGGAGRCWAGACCTSCWDGERCLPPGEQSAAAYGIEGTECVSCDCAGDALNPEGGCTPREDAGGIAAGAEHACAVLGESVYCWGANEEGQVGTGRASAPVTEPRAVYRRGDPVAGDAHTCLSDGTITTCWGRGSEYQLGDGAGSNERSPGDAVIDLAYGRLAAGQRHTCGVRDGVVYCWGANSDGQCGQGESVLFVETPTEVSLPGVVTDIAAGRRTTCAIADEHLYCWGFNDHGSVGVPRAQQRVFTPVDVSADLRFSRVSVGLLGACAVTTDGVLYCRGFALTDIIDDLGPDDLANLHRFVAIGDERWREVALGEDHLCGIRADDRLVCLGQNAYGQLGGEGDGRVVHGPVGYRWRTAVSGTGYSCARREDDTVFCWGANDLGQLGVPGPSSSTPRRICPTPEGP